MANTDSVSDFDGARQIIATALEAFGDLHVVVNNAGILRDRMLVSMSEEEFDQVVAVHLKGTFNVTRHAADVWRERSKAGDNADRAIVNTSSSSGLHGNPGQTNYSAAKAGVAAMTVIHAQELSRYGVRANAIAPVARTRMTLATPGMGEMMGASLFDPEHIAPLVAVLASERCPFTGQVFSVYGGAVGIYQGWSVHQEVVSATGTWTPDELELAMQDLPREVPITHQMALISEKGEGEG